MLALKLSCEEHIQFYQVNYLQALRLFKFSFFLVKMINHYEVHVIF